MNDVMPHGVPVCCSSIVHCHWGLYIYMERPLSHCQRHYTRWSVGTEGVLCVATHTFMYSAVYTGTYGV